MAIASKPKPTAKHHKKRTAAHHRQTKHYMKSYWPYLPMAAIVATGFMAANLLHRPMVLGTQANLTTARLVVETNQARQQAHQPDLQLNEQLDQAAQAKADDMAKRNYWSHISPSGQQPWDFITNAGYQYGAAGENLAYGFSDAGVVTRAWLHSPEHRQNLLSGSFTQVGFGVSQSRNYMGTGPETITVALYARPTIADGGIMPASTVTPSNSQPVSRVSASIAPAFAGFLVGILGSVAIIYVVGRHSIMWRRLVNRGEMFVIHHPAVDVSLIAVATLAVVMSQTVGFIH